tara:strand:+ start:18745 stop:19311 length:567 start_codon:yes stop_codon:yes gene_type:complete
MNIDQLKAATSKGRGFASANQFMVTLPSLGKYDIRNLNVLCTNVNMPGRQILTQERLIGIKGRKMPNGFASDDVSMTFHVMNDYTIKKYFEEWQDRVISQDSFEVAYTNEYAKDVIISQLKKGTPFDFPIDKIFGLDTRTKDSWNSVYQVKLLDAFPTTMNAIEFNNEQDGLVKLNVQLSYKNWTRAI